MFKSDVTNRAGVVVARVVFSDRTEGLSSPPFNALNLANHVGDAPIAVGMNRARFAAEIGAMSDRITWPGLTHSTNIGFVDQPLSHFPDVDVLITKQRKQALATLGADCVQILAVDPEQKLIASGHMGWRGASANFAEILTAAFADYGGKLKATKFWLGPAICGTCYQVPAERIAAVSKYLPAAATASGLDLRIGLSDYLNKAGASVTLIGGCTSCDENYFSYRRDGLTGRQGGAVMLV